MLQQFHRFYPQGSLVSELLDIDRGLYIVKVSAQQQDQVLGTGLAAADTVEKAEDQARQRALATLNYSQNPIAENSQRPVFSPRESTVAKISNDQRGTSLYAVPESVPPVVNDSVAPDSASTWENSEENKSFDPSFSSNGGSSSSTQSVTTTQTITAPITETQPEAASPDIFEQPLTSEVETQTNIFDQPLTPDPEITSPPAEVAPEATENTVELDFNEVIHRIDLEMKRLNWTKEQGRDYLLSTYGKRSRLHLTNEELVEFLTYVEGLAS